MATLEHKDESQLKGPPESAITRPESAISRQAKSGLD